MTDARLPPGKTLGSFDFTVVPMVSQAQVMALISGDRWLDEGANLIQFGPPRGGKSHLAAANGIALVEAAYRRGDLFEKRRAMMQERADFIIKL
ncbi:ATP-binding protein [Billgrantia montanilacus]|uniref:ATP-binding protein n=1 Tax=Billgrantia montanilacus TaxID=2282305 RepID=UPI002482BA12|nr:ATP-binding protein [Halomonas montanilacus]